MKEIDSRCLRGAALVLRIPEDNPDHHLWNNRGTWWCHFTLHKADYTTERVRLSLKTPNREEARKRRDHLFARLKTQSSVKGAAA